MTERKMDEQVHGQTIFKVRQKQRIDWIKRGRQGKGREVREGWKERRKGEWVGKR